MPTKAMALGSNQGQPVLEDFVAAMPVEAIRGRTRSPLLDRKNAGIDSGRQAARRALSCSLNEEGR